MADGDASAGTAASGIGLAVMTGLEKVKYVWRFVNSTRDMIANHITSGTHAASAIISGVLDAARIPTLDASKIGTGNIDAARLPTYIAGSKLYGNIDQTQNGAGSNPSFVTGTVLANQKIYSLAGPSNSVTPFATVAWKTSTGELGVAASSRRFKRDIVTATPRRTLLAARVVNYRMKSEVKEVGEAATVYIGLIAEELHKLGLVEYVVYMDGKPFAINYDRIVCDQLMIIQDHDARLEALEGKS